MEEKVAQARLVCGEVAAQTRKLIALCAELGIDPALQDLVDSLQVFNSLRVALHGEGEPALAAQIDDKYDYEDIE